MNQTVEIVDFGDRAQLVERLRPQLAPGVKAERFVAAIMTAVRRNPDLGQCDRKTLWTACEQAAQDGLMPDGREGAIVSYNVKQKDGSYKKVAQWLPMIAGIRKKAFQSGEIKEWYTGIVYEGDEWDYELGDDPHFKHRPAPPTDDDPQMICAYSIAVLKDGYRTAPEVMWRRDIMAIRGKSKAKFGPWDDPTFFSEMVRKTVAKRHGKVLPSSTDLDQVLSRDDNMYELAAPQREAPKIPKPPERKAIEARNDETANVEVEAEGDPVEVETVDAETGEIVEEKAAEIVEEKAAEIVEEAQKEGPVKVAEEANSHEEEPPRTNPLATEPDKFIDDLEGQLAGAKSMADLFEIVEANIAPHIDDGRVFPSDRTRVNDMLTKRRQELNPEK